MATKRKSSSVSGLVKTKQSLRAQLSKINQKKRDKRRAEKLRREVESLRRKVKAANGGSRKRK